jgi:hypothetical protein
MGNRRIGRKRLYAVEKKGQKVDLGAGAGIKDYVVSATQHRNGLEIITEIQMDLGAGSLLEGGGNNRVIAKAGAAGALTQLTVAKYGHITEFRVVVTEAPVGNSSDGINLAIDSDGTFVQGGSDTPTARVQELKTKGMDKSYTPNNSGTHQTASSEEYLYLTCDDGGNASSAFSAGKIIIYLHGFAEPDDA